MISLLIAFLFVLLAPLFLANWRTSILGLSLQGVLLASMATRLHGGELTVANLLNWLDFGLVRGVVAPLMLYRVLLSRRAPDRNDVLPPNMLAWAAAVGVVILSFRLASMLVPVDGDDQMLVAVVSSGVFLGFLVLATQVGVFSQIVGVLRLENAIALFELGGHESGDYLGLRLGAALVFVASLALFRFYLVTAPLPAVVEPSPEPEDD